MARELLRTAESPDSPVTTMHSRQPDAATLGDNNVPAAILSLCTCTSVNTTQPTGQLAELTTQQLCRRQAKSQTPLIRPLLLLLRSRILVLLHHPQLTEHPPLCRHPLHPMYT
jgi:hypothetical protein